VGFPSVTTLLGNYGFILLCAVLFPAFGAAVFSPLFRSVRTPTDTQGPRQPEARRFALTVIPWAWGFITCFMWLGLGINLLSDLSYWGIRPERVTAIEVSRATQVFEYDPQTTVTITNQAAIGRGLATLEQNWTYVPNHEHFSDGYRVVIRQPEATYTLWAWKKSTSATHVSNVTVVDLSARWGPVSIPGCRCSCPALLRWLEQDVEKQGDREAK
jgi:hypothetical protein